MWQAGFVLISAHIQGLFCSLCIRWKAMCFCSIPAHQCRHLVGKIFSPTWVYIQWQSESSFPAWGRSDQPNQDILHRIRWFRPIYDQYIHFLIGSGDLGQWGVAPVVKFPFKDQVCTLSILLNYVLLFVSQVEFIGRCISISFGS